MNSSRAKNTLTIRGLTTLSNTAQLDVTIADVGDVAKARISHLSVSYGVSAAFGDHSVRVSLLNSTTLRFNRLSATAISSVCSWEVTYEK